MPEGEGLNMSEAPTGDAAAVLAKALDRSLSWDMPEPVSADHAVATSVQALAPKNPMHATHEDNLPMPPPFKIKMVEEISLLPRQQREEVLHAAGYNIFALRAEQVFIDLLTDSGTSAMSDVQWAGMTATPQAYAGSSSFYTLESVARDLFGFKHVLPQHQGRAAENVLFSTLFSNAPAGALVPNNSHFDTTEANVLRCGGRPVNLPVPEAYDTACPAPFKGNMDVVALAELLQEHGADKVPVVMLTITNNTAGGQPVSMANIRETSALARRHGIPLFLDAARFAENAWLIKQYEPGYRNVPLRDIVREAFSYADGCTFSGKKEALANTGGLLCVNDTALYEQLRNLTVVVEGFPSYGGMACRDLMAMARGMLEATEEAYQHYRHSQIELLAGLLRRAGVPIVEPPGGHAVYVDAAHFLPHVPPEQFPAQALTAALYIVCGVRAVEIGSSCFGHVDEDTGAFVPARLELMRLAVPRRVYTDNHLRYVAAGIARLYAQRSAICGLRRVYAARLLSHFTARFEVLSKDGLIAPSIAAGRPLPSTCHSSSSECRTGDGAHTCAVDDAVE